MADSKREDFQEAIEMLKVSMSIYDRKRAEVDNGKTAEDRESAAAWCASALQTASEHHRKLRAMFPTGTGTSQDQLDGTFDTLLDEIERRWREQVEEFESVRAAYKLAAGPIGEA